jgi:hypothetical protein
MRRKLSEPGMHTRVRPAESLLGLLRLEDTAERRSCWRQTLAALGGSARVTGPPPLDNVEPQTLLEAVQVALSTGLVDDLDWIAPGQGAVALYELTRPSHRASCAVSWAVASSHGCTKARRRRLPW